MDNIKKIGLVILLVLTIMIGNHSNSMAYSCSEYRQSSILPAWTSTTDITAYLTSSANNLSPEINVTAKNPSYRISGTMYLERYSSGRWVSVSSWSFSGTGSIVQYKNYTGLPGNTYRTRVSANVNGERVSNTSRSITL